MQAASGEPIGSIGRAFTAMLPDGVSVAAVVVDPTHYPGLHRLERASAHHFAPLRRIEFASGRVAAHRALASLGWPAEPILIGPLRAPCWPSGIVGSITHAAGMTVAAVCPDAQLTGLGIDLERIDAVDDDLSRYIMSAAEIAAKPESCDFRLWQAIHFSAKESVFKALFPAVGRIFEFHDMCLAIKGGRFTASPRSGFDVPGASTVSGAYRCCDGLIVSAAWLCSDGSRLRST